ncbi:MAG: putative Zn peptidase [Gemmataceae bacterium]|nr:putative Zn peptidase [Gemmataceae bacterium]
MSRSGADRIAAAIADVRRRARWQVDPAVRGPVPLDRLYQGVNVAHTAVHDLTLGTAARHLVEQRYVNGPHTVEDLWAEREPLAGLLFWLCEDGLAFVRAGDILPRRRFTAAHELGHAVLHRDRMGRFLADPAISESDDATDEREREANRFAAELLMPGEVIRARAEELKREHGRCPRGVLEYRLAAELLVSGEAIRYRLNTLGVGND